MTVLLEKQRYTVSEPGDYQLIIYGHLYIIPMQGAFIKKYI